MKILEKGSLIIIISIISSIIIIIMINIMIMRVKEKKN